METKVLSQEERKTKYKSPHFVSTLQEQNYAKLSKLKTKFTDELFPPEESSIYTGVIDHSIEPEIPKFLKKQVKITQPLGFGKEKYTWKRLSELYKISELNIVKEPANIKDIPDILTNDVIQGQIGDCYFLSVLSSFAEKSKRIKNFFPTMQISPNGIYEARIFLHGEPVNVVVDDYFPCVENENGLFRIAFTGINESTKNVWAMILEKIWAKLNFTYENIIAGVPSDAFEFLCPCPIDDYFHDISGQEIFDIVIEADSKDFIITCAITPSHNQNLAGLAKMGLITNHAYSIIKAIVITELDGTKVKLFKIRNPWASNEWQGDWSDKSSKWTPEIKKLVEYSDSDDGVFYICIEDFLKYYTLTTIAHYYDSYNFVGSKFPFDPSQVYNMVSVKVPTSGTGYFILNQKNQRIYRNCKGIEEFENRQCNMIVFRRNEEDELEYVSSFSGHDNRHYINSELLAGTYIIAVSFPSNTSLESNSYESFKEKYVKTMEPHHLTFRVGLYSNVEKVVMTALAEKDLNLYTDFLKELAFNNASKEEGKHHFVEEGEKDGWRKINYQESSSAFGYICYNNPTDAYINEQITFNKLFGINIIPFLEESVEPTECFEKEIEDPFERQAVHYLKKKPEVSEFKYLQLPKPSKEIGSANQVVISVKIAPYSKAVIILEKFDSDSGIEVESNVVLTYPLHILLHETKSQNKKSRIKYNNKLVEIFEVVSEHNKGVVFKYRNRTKDLKLIAHIKFTHLTNLVLSTRSDDIIFSEGNEDDEKEETEKIIKKKNDLEANFNIKDRKKELVIGVDPGQTVFFELSSLEIFDPFSYGCEMDYHINLSRNQI